MDWSGAVYSSSFREEVDLRLSWGCINPYWAVLLTDVVKPALAVAWYARWRFFGRNQPQSARQQFHERPIYHIRRYRNRVSTLYDFALCRLIPIGSVGQRQSVQVEHDLELVGVAGRAGLAVNDAHL